MSIFLGNLELKDIVKKDYIEIIKSFLDNNGFNHTCNTGEVEKQEGNYHIYDIPRTMTICGETKAREFVKFLKKENLVEGVFIGEVSISITEFAKKKGRNE